jgi:hypothetical protein
MITREREAIKLNPSKVERRRGRDIERANEIRCAICMNKELSAFFLDVELEIEVEELLYLFRIFMGSCFCVYSL